MGRGQCVVTVGTGGVFGRKGPGIVPLTSAVGADSPELFCAVTTQKNVWPEFIGFVGDDVSAKVRTFAGTLPTVTHVGLREVQSPATVARLML